MRITAKARILGVGVLIGAVVTGCVALGINVAFAGGTSTTYYACLSTRGALSKVGTTAPVCTRSATQISWNSQGATGPPGPAGPTTAGATGFNAVVETNTTSTGTASVQCPPSNPYALGGGGSAASLGSSTVGALTSSAPTSSDFVPNGWTVSGTSGSEVVDVYAICSA